MSPVIILSVATFLASYTPAYFNLMISIPIKHLPAIITGVTALLLVANVIMKFAAIRICSRNDRHDFVFNRLNLAFGATKQLQVSFGRRMDAQHEDIVALRALFRIRAGDLDRQMPGVLGALRTQFAACTQQQRDMVVQVGELATNVVELGKNLERLAAGSVSSLGRRSGGYDR